MLLTLNVVASPGCLHPTKVLQAHSLTRHAVMLSPYNVHRSKDLSSIPRTHFFFK